MTASKDTYSYPVLVSYHITNEIIFKSFLTSANMLLTFGRGDHGLEISSLFREHRFSTSTNTGHYASELSHLKMDPGYNRFKLFCRNALFVRNMLSMCR